MRCSMLATIAAAASVYGECFTGGANWASQKPKALSLASEVCNVKFSKKEFFAGEAELGACYDIGDGKIVNFNLMYIGTDATRTPTAAECYDGFQKEVNGCEFGGGSEYTNWRYT